MASPQPTPFVRFSKELFEAFYMNPPATIASCRLWLWVLRWTWADFGKLETKERSRSQIAIEVGMSKAQVIKELAALVRCRRLKVGKEGGYAIQKDYDLWRDDTKKRDRHFGNTMKQAPLFTPADNLGITSEIGSYGEPTAVHRANRNRFTVAHSVGSPCEPPIRSKNTVENKGEVRGTRAPQFLSNGKKDTPRNRAALGHPDFPPDEHPDFKRLPFDLTKELVSTWNGVVQTKIKATACRRGCGRQKASESWPYCRPCTVCHNCQAPANGQTKFQSGPGGILCTKCVEEISREV